MITGAELPLTGIHGVLDGRPSLLRSTVVFSFCVGGSGSSGRNNRFHIPGAIAQPGGVKGLKPSPLSNQNIDVYCLNFSPILQVEIGCIAKCSLAVPQGVATHSLSNQAVVSFRDL